MEAIINITLFVLLLLLGVSAGGFNERRHLRSLAQREVDLSRILTTNLRTIPQVAQVGEPMLVVGQVVVATDYFKTLATSLRNLVGGEMRSADKLLSRGRREALLRLKEQAHAMGATEVHNIRFTFCNVGMMRGRGGAMQVEVMAYGTAVRREVARTG